jgi:galactose-1-phosphate uridylyltransferase
MISQSHQALQHQLEQVFAASNLSTVAEQLYDASLSFGWLATDALAANHYTQSFTNTYQLTLKAQVNLARSRYQAPQSDSECPLCLPKHPLINKRCGYQLSLDKQAYYLQASPFPLFAHHFVLIQQRHQPMFMQAQSLRELCHWVDLAPDYLALSNSDTAFAGASILGHQHYQVVRHLTLPISSAKAQQQIELGNTRLSLLHYPMSSLRLECHDKKSLIQLGGRLITWWKNQQEKNSCNLVLAKKEQGYQLEIILRNGKHRTPQHLQSIKSEGIGVIEAAGYAILPEPQGPNAEQVWQKIKTNSGQILIDILRGNSPTKESGYLQLWQQILTALKQPQQQSQPVL